MGMTAHKGCPIVSFWVMTSPRAGSATAVDISSTLKPALEISWPDQNDFKISKYTDIFPFTG